MDPTTTPLSLINHLAGRDTTQPGELIINDKLRLSQCDIWPMLEQLYETGGKGLWETVPFYVTSSTFLAETYAELIVSFLIDYYLELDKQEPIYIIEMGTGTGCLSFYLMKELARKRRFFSHINELKLKYVMCDFSTNTISSWLNSAELSRFRDDGTLEFAIFKPEHQTEIITYDSTRIAADTVKNPVIAIANYFFDSLRHDAFRIHEHRLEEVLHTFYRANDEIDSTRCPFDLLRKCETYLEVSGDYYDSSVHNAVLRSYAVDFENASILYPIGGFKCIENLRTLSGDQLVLLSTDKGYTNANFMQGHWEQPFCSHNGIFSYSVNYDAIARYFDHLGGCSFASNLPSFSVETQMSLLLKHATADSLQQTRYHFMENVAKKSPINGLYYSQHLLTPAGTCSNNDMVRAYISFVRTSNCDPISLYMCADVIAVSVSEVTVDLRRQLLDVLSAVEDNFYHVRNRTDVLYQIGLIRYMVDEYEGCVKAMNRSIALFGENGHSLYYLAACMEIRGDYSSALDMYSRSSSLDPNCELTRKAVDRMQGKLGELQRATSAVSDPLPS